MITILITKKLSLFKKWALEGCHKIKHKIHLLGKLYEEGRQLRIVKITSGSFKETIYRQHKNCIKTYTTNQRKKKLPIRINIKLQSSLISQQLKLLKIAWDSTNEMEEVNFSFAEVHSSLKFILSTTVKIGIQSTLKLKKILQIWYPHSILILWMKIIESTKINIWFLLTFRQMCC